MDACPPLEDIAAFLDGTLSPEERARITEHLARCQSCYEIFAGAVHFQEEESSAEDTDEGGVLPFPLRGEKDRAPRRISRWLPLAASVVLAAGLGWTGWRLFFAPPEITLAGVIEPIETKTGISDLLYQGDTPRGPGDPEGTFSPGPELMTGVHLVDLRLSVEAENVEATARLLQDLGTALQDVLWLPGLSQRYHDESLKMQTVADLERFAAELPDRESEIQESLSESTPFSFGLWAEAGRLAAKTRTREFFDRWKNRRFLSSLLKGLPGEGDESLETVPGDLEAIQEIWDRGGFSRQDYEALAGHFQKIIETYEKSSSELGDPSDPGE